MSIKKHIPNLFTLGNLFCGVLGIIFLLMGPFVPGGDISINDHSLVITPVPNGEWMIAVLMIIAMVLDFFDGFVARALGVAGPLGKELDSLADGVTFGVLPGLLMFKMILNNRIFGELAGQWGLVVYVLPLFALMIPLLSAMRLAKFNIDERQGDTFYGLPTPANAFLILSLFLMFAYDSGLDNASWPFSVADGGGPRRHYSFNEVGELTEPAAIYRYVLHPITLGLLSLVLSWVLVADIRLIALKFKNYSWKDNQFRYILVGLSVVLLATLWHRGVPLVIALYFGLSILNNIIDKKKNKDEVHS